MATLITSSYYIYLDFDWESYGEVSWDSVFLNNSKLYKCEYWIDLEGREHYSCDYRSGLQKLTGDGYATYVYYYAPLSRPR